MVTRGHLRVTVGHLGSPGIGPLRVTVVDLLETIGDLRFKIGYLKATVFHISVLIRLPKVNYRSF